MDILPNLILFFAILVFSVGFATWSACRLGALLIKLEFFTVRVAELTCLALYAGGCTLLITAPEPVKAAAFASLFLITFSIVLLFATSKPMRTGS